ncbi:F-box protein [Phanerochaete sordida]|uniref:F-box protein n=1 Tax=Phanerochaete sordida TaxID=48140 RepID=A0A9P3GC74_9APHY|nr:F-box protein [Phanerochaete sordida]
MPLRFPDLSFLFTKNRTENKCSIDVLPNDVLVDGVFDYLDVVEILRLRRASKLYYHLTHHAVVWKRLLQRCSLPLPPLPPTARHNLENLTGLECERLLTRAHSVDKIWRTSPKFYDLWRFDAYYQIAHMTMLPGGQYLVASVCDRDREDWWVVVYALDSRYNAVPVLREATRSKAYHLTAKYLTLNGVHGIMLSFVVRLWKHRAHWDQGININEYAPDTDLDPPFPMKYECHTYHIPLAALEAQCDPRMVPNSQECINHALAQAKGFNHVYLMRSCTPISSVSLDDVYGVPCITAVKQPMTIMFKPLALPSIPPSMVTLAPFHGHEDFPQRIKAVRPLPLQRQWLVFHESRVPQVLSRHPIMSFQMINMPDNKTGNKLEYVQPTQLEYYLSDDTFAEVYITEHSTPNWFDDSIAPSIRANRQGDAWRPGTVSAFLRTTSPDDGLLRMTFYPRQAPAEAPPRGAATPLCDGRPLAAPARVWKYDLEWCSPVRFITAHQNCKYRILAGARRTLLYTVAWDAISATPEIDALHRYYDSELEADAPELRDGELFVDETPRYPVRRLPFQFPGGQRMEAVCWDDTIGRVCFVAPEDSRVLVLDFAKRPKEDFLGRRLPIAPEQDQDAMLVEEIFDDDAEDSPAEPVTGVDAAGNMQHAASPDSGYAELEAGPSKPHFL